MTYLNGTELRGDDCVLDEKGKGDRVHTEFNVCKVLRLVQ